MLLPVSMYTGGNTSADMNRESKPHVIRSVGSMGLEVRARDTEEMDSSLLWMIQGALRPWKVVRDELR